MPRFQLPSNDVPVSRAEGPQLVLCGTYTVDPLAEVVEYWLDFLGIDASLAVAPYAQVFQQLLDPGSTMRRNRAGANVVLLRWADLLGHPESAAGDAGRGEVGERIEEIASALRSFKHQVPCLVLVGPPGSGAAARQWATAALQSRLANVSNVFVESGERGMQRYRVDRWDDPGSDRFGHVPYTAEALAALGTVVARWYAAVVRAPLKLIAVDGDHTLWSGVVAEDGVDALRVEGAHAGLQQALALQARSGRLLCLLSKNDAADVSAVFRHRGAMPLQWADFTASRIDWNPKPDNLRHVIADLSLGLDSVAFLDDNPVECAQMRARCPQVTTVRVPTEPERLAAFTEHLWLLDPPPATDEDRGRARMYRERTTRERARQDANSLQSFMDGLELVAEIEPPGADEWPRLAQLTQRTNQFNASLIRCSVADVCDRSGGAGGFHRLLRARDRFGDYGIVGQVRARPQGDCLLVDLFMLSCRALGRGLEHRLLAAAGAHAVTLGLAEVAVKFVAGERNAPVRSFLEHIAGRTTAGCGTATSGRDENRFVASCDRATHEGASTGTAWFRLAAPLAAAVAFDASAAGVDEPPALSRGVVSLPEAPSSRSDPAGHAPGELYERIAYDMTSAAAIVRAMASRIRLRPEMAVGFVAPAAGHEREIAGIWQEVLRVESVGANDRFQDLGGKSIHLVQVHSLLLDRLGVELDITALFQHPTVASLAAYLAAQAPRGATGAARQRAAKIRQARARAQTRHRKPSGIGESA